MLSKYLEVNYNENVNMMIAQETEGGLLTGRGGRGIANKPYLECRLYSFLYFSTCDVW
jgi:hypothetical protein